MQKPSGKPLNLFKREFMSDEGGFFSALDADSEGEEGKFYTWQKNEISEILGTNAEAFCEYYDVTERGNWEGKNILRILRIRRNSHTWRNRKREWKKKLMERTRTNGSGPQLDDKILSGWNALMITAFVRPMPLWVKNLIGNWPIKSMGFLEEKMRGKGIFHFYHSYKESMRMGEYGSEGKATIPAFLDDYAYIIEAYIQLQEVTGDASYLITSQRLDRTGL